MGDETDQVKTEWMINDVRDISEFKTTSFSGYKRTDVKKEMFQSLYKSKIENACYWCAELICSAHFMDVWDIILMFYGKHVHLANPKIAIYLDKRFQVFRNIMIQGIYYDELQLRNSNTIRNMFAEMCCILASAPKKPPFEPVKINKEEEFDITQMSLKLKAPHIQYAEPLMKKDDPKELTIAINEFAYHISHSNDHLPNLANACYWIEWIISFEQICKKKKIPCIAETRENIPVEFKYQKETIWILWDALFYTVKEDEFTTKVLHSILRLFCVKFTPASMRKRAYLLYFATSIVTEPYRRNIPMIEQKSSIEKTLSEIHIIYRQIKKSESSPKTDYLFQGLHDRGNIQKSLQKIELLNSLQAPKLEKEDL